jgi:hypothetical protein
MLSRTDAQNKGAGLAWDRSLMGKLIAGWGMPSALLYETGGWAQTK